MSSPRTGSPAATQAEPVAATQVETWDVAEVSLALSCGPGGIWSVVVSDLGRLALSIGSMARLESLEVLLMDHRPSSVYLLAGDPSQIDAQTRHLHRIIGQAAIETVVEVIKPGHKCLRKEVSLESITRDLEKILDAGSDIHPVMGVLRDHPGVLHCLSCVIVADELGTRPKHSQSFSVEALRLKDALYLDSAAVEGLQILTPRTAVRTGAEAIWGIQSVEDLFRTNLRTPMGGKKLQHWLLYPTKCAEELRLRHDIVSVLVKSESVRRVISVQSLRKMSDLDKITALFRRRRMDPNAPLLKGLNLTTIMGLYSTIKESLFLESTLRAIGDDVHTWAEDEEEGQSFSRSIETLRERLETDLKPLSKFLHLVDHTINVESFEKNPRAAHYDPASYLNPEVCDELHQLHNYKQSLWKRMEKYRDDLASQMDQKSSKAKIKTERLKLLRDEKEGFILRSTKIDHATVTSLIGAKSIKFSRLNKNEFLFTTEEFHQLKAEYIGVRDQSNLEGKKVVTMLIDVASSYAKPVDKLSGQLASIDILQSFAFIASGSRYTWTRPTIEAEGDVLELKDCRHALLCERDRGDGEKKIIGNDVILDQNGLRFGLITGPNMGGKSTYIRSAALCVLLAQIGSFVPCSFARVPILNQILCRVGASDSIMTGVSTFMAEMIETSVVCSMADARTLVLIDELGRGTSTADGFGIAYAIAEHLATEIKCMTFFATHFSEMAELMDNPATKGSVASLHLTSSTSADNDENRPLDENHKGIMFHYKIAEGVCTQSYGIHVAKIADFPPELIHRAERMLTSLDHVNQDGQM